jgi:hypothetical protein
MQRFLQQQPGYEVCVLHGRSIATIAQLCEQLERQIPGPPLARTLDGTGGIIDLLRSWEPLPELSASDSGLWMSPAFGGPTRRRARFIVWNDAEHLYRADAQVFARVVDGLMGVAAEGEYGPVERLMIQRVVFCGGPLLERLAREPQGPFRSWWRDGSDADAFWSLISGVERPPVTLADIEELMNPASGLVA